MNARAVPLARFALAGAAHPCLSRISCVCTLLFTLAGCVHYERQGTAAPPLVVAQRRLAQVEKRKADPQGHATACLAVAKVAATEIAKGCSATDPSSNSAVGLYNRAAADLAADLPALIRQQGNARAFTLRDPQSGEAARLQVASGQAGEYPAGFFQQMLVASRIDKKGLKDDVTRGGVGGAVVGVRQSSMPGAAPPRLEPLTGFRVPVTAVVDFSGAKGPLDARLRLLDPTNVDSITVGHTRQPLAADYSAAMASYGRTNETWVGFVNMVRGERMRGPKGLLLLQPYDPDKLPVIFVHGLLSSAYTWRNVANSLNADPELRRRCQFWAFAYSTGNPIPYSAQLLREDLAYAQQTFGIKQAVLVGHSMGGLLSRLQVTNSGRALWDGIFGSKADALYAEAPPDSLVKRALVFSANPTVRRVIFVATPHRGSSLAAGGIGALAIRLIRLSLTVERAISSTMRAALAPNNDPRKYRAPTSIFGLSPKNPLLLALDKLPMEAPHHSIIGDRGRGDTPRSSDGVVPYWSSHLDSARSELIVPANHGAMNHPKAVAEIRRILLEQLRQARPRQAVAAFARTAGRRGRLRAPSLQGLKVPAYSPLAPPGQSHPSGCPCRAKTAQPT
ncbi:MAG: alpha/beta fold hydrolase [Verrucomicrobia bacterium]|nr:alpha/beta fold hydrolase [Verrucomicrobiota bacterium]